MQYINPRSSSRLTFQRNQLESVTNVNVSTYVTTGVEQDTATRSEFGVAP